MKAALTLLPPLLAVLLTGCVSSPAPVLPPPPGQSVREQFGRMGVLVFTTAPGIKIETPASKGAAAGRCAKMASFGPLGAAVGDVRALALALAWMPVGLAAGGTYGALKGESQAALAAGSAALADAVQRLEYHERLLADLRQLAAEKACRPLRPVPAACRVARQVNSDFCDVYFGSTYPNLPAHEIDSVLEVEIIAPALTGPSGINPDLSFNVDAKVRIIAASDNQLLYSDYLEYRSPKHSFAEWADNDARLLRSEIQSSLPLISGEIVRQIFLRTVHESFPAGSNLHRSAK